MNDYSLSHEQKTTMVNEMSDENAKCPECGKRGFDSVTTALSHHNQKHDDVQELRRTEVCEACDEMFVPSNSENPNRFCSRDCFQKALRFVFKK